ncbi:hypothetical protein RRG08_005446 [Elysia crispata]|uniref:Uncharacterized protein n=1 Tax=Elysia crispata TaxID=231223 RepID=A0AAE0Y0Y6_9GAST|nr:hypothetical protein RRG08_005446 [Elysia crispata]
MSDGQVRYGRLNDATSSATSDTSESRSVNPSTFPTEESESGERRTSGRYVIRSHEGREPSPYLNTDKTGNTKEDVSLPQEIVSVLSIEHRLSGDETRKFVNGAPTNQAICLFTYNREIEKMEEKCGPGNSVGVTEDLRVPESWSACDSWCVKASAAQPYGRHRESRSSMDLSAHDRRS